MCDCKSQNKTQLGENLHFAPEQCYVIGSYSTCSHISERRDHIQVPKAIPKPVYSILKPKVITKIMDIYMLEKHHNPSTILRFLN